MNEYLFFFPRYSVHRKLPQSKEYCRYLLHLCCSAEQIPDSFGVTLCIIESIAQTMDMQFQNIVVITIQSSCMHRRKMTLIFVTSIFRQVVSLVFPSEYYHYLRLRLQRLMIQKLLAISSCYMRRHRRHHDHAPRFYYNFITLLQHSADLHSSMKDHEGVS